MVAFLNDLLNKVAYHQKYKPSQISIRFSISPNSK